MSSKEEKEEFARINNITIDTVALLTTRTDIVCLKCGRYKPIVKTKQSKIGMRLDRCNNKECHHLYGKKRPEHSRIMKEKARTCSTSEFNKSLFQKGEIRNKTVNTLEWKKLILEKNNFEITEDTDILELFSVYLSQRGKSRSTRTQSMVTWYTKLNSDLKELCDQVIGEVTNEFLSSLNNEEFNDVFKTFHGICTAQNVKNSLTARSTFFKGELLIDLKYNTENCKSVRTRSGWETSAIRLFEQHAIPWSYEEITLVCKDNKKLYTPDFKILYEGKTYLIELKGRIFRSSIEDYFTNKVQAGVDYARLRGWYFLYIDKEPKTIEFLKNPVDIGEEHGIS